MAALISRRSLVISALGLNSSAIACAKEPKRTRVYQWVQMRTSLGDLTLAVDQERAPISTGSFLNYVDKHLLDGAQFYRVVHPGNDVNPAKISVVQGGVVDESHMLPSIPHEPTTKTGLRHMDGTISIARREPGSGSGGSFFICIGDQPALDYGGKRNPDGQGFAAFGGVVKGMDVVRAIWAGQTKGTDGSIESQILASPDSIVSVRRRKGPSGN